MRALICHFLGHKVRVGLWEPTRMESPNLPKWFRFIDCARCGDRLHTQTVKHKRKPLDAYETELKP
jgi:hypothetical protein